jgi:hypothetical protein
LQLLDFLTLMFNFSALRVDMLLGLLIGDLTVEA